MVTKRVTSVSDYLAILDSTLKKTAGTQWFRGHADLTWHLAPSALRYRTIKEREKALRLFIDFRRHANFRIERPPPLVPDGQPEGTAATTTVDVFQPLAQFAA